MNRVACIQFARLQSTRLPDKLLRTVNGESLVDRGCRYMRRLADATGITPLLAIHPQDVALITAAAEAGIEVLHLTDAALTARIWPELIQPHTGTLAERFDFVWDANILCRPFLQLSTGEFLARQCQAATRPFVAVTRRRGIVWSETSPVPVIGAGQLADTRNNPHYFEPSHLAYAYPAWMLPLSERQLAEAVAPLEVRLEWFERIDIDTPQDLALAQAVAGSIAQ